MIIVYTTEYVSQMQLPTCSQGASFRNGKLMITRSFVRNPFISNNYVSELYCYNGSNISTTVKKYILPPMAEGIYIGASYTYIIYESSSTIHHDAILRCPYVL